MEGCCRQHTGFYKALPVGTRIAFDREAKAHAVAAKAANAKARGEIMEELRVAKHLLPLDLTTAFNNFID